MPSNHLILCHPHLLLPSIFPSIRVFSNESVLQIRWTKYWSFSFSISPSNEYSRLTSFRMDWLDLLAVQVVPRILSTEDSPPTFHNVLLGAVMPLRRTTDLQLSKSAENHWFTPCKKQGRIPVEKIPWRRKWQPTPVFLPGKPHRQRSLAGYSPWGLRESDTTEHVGMLTRPSPSNIQRFMFIISKAYNYPASWVWWYSFDKRKQMPRKVS